MYTLGLHWPSLAYVGPTLTYVKPTLTYVGPTFAYVGPTSRLAFVGRRVPSTPFVDLRSPSWVSGGHWWHALAVVLSWVSDGLRWLLLVIVCSGAAVVDTI